MNDDESVLFVVEQCIRL